MQSLIEKLTALHHRVKITHVEDDSFNVYLADHNREKVVKAAGGYKIQHWNRQETRTLNDAAVVGFFEMKIKRNNL